MAFVYTWNSAFVALPANTELESLGAQRIRDFKAAFAERFQICFSLNGDQYDGQCLGLYFNPTTPVNAGPVLFSGNAGDGYAELYFKDSVGNITQITNSGAVNATTIIPSGSRMTFLQAAVPLNWTHDTSLNDCVVRINSASGGGNGGSWTISGVTIGGTVLTQSQLPGGTYYATVSGGVGSLAAGTSVGYAGEGNTHTHSFASNSSWRPAYTDAVVGVKN